MNIIKVKGLGPYHIRTTLTSYSQISILEPNWHPVLHRKTVMKFLIVVDNSSDCTLLIDTLSKDFNDSEFVEVAGRESLEAALAKGDFDLVLTEYKLGWTDGLSVLKLVKRHFSDEPVVMVTSYGSEEIAVEGLKAGLSDYVTWSNLVRLPETVKASLARATQLRQAQKNVEELRLSEERFGLAAELTSDFAYAGTVTAAGILEFDWLTPAFWQLTGFNSAEWAGRSWEAVIYPDDIAFAKAHFERLLSGQPSTAEYRIITVSGKPCWVKDQARPIWDATEGRVIYIYGATQNITKRKQAEEELFQREQEFRALIENSPDVVTRYDRDGRIVYINSAVQHVMGMPAQAFTGKTFTEIGVSQERVDFWDKAISDVFKTGQKKTLEYFTLAQGQAVYYQTSLVPEFAPDNSVQYVLGVSRDISGIKRSEEVLQRQEQEFRTLAENAPVIIARFDRNFRYTYINPAIEEPSQIAAHEFIGKTNAELGFSPEVVAQWEAGMQAVFETGQPQSLEFNFNLPHGQYYFQARYVPELDKSGIIKSLLCIVNDITQIHQTQEALFRQEREFRTLAENSPDMITRFDREKRYLYVNPAATVPSQIPASKFIGKTHTELGFSTENMAGWEQTVKKVFETGQTQSYDFSYKVPEGVHYYQTKQVPEFDENGNIESILTIAHDVTQIKRAEAALAEEKERLSVTLHSMGDGMLATDTNGKIVLVNPVAETLTGWSSAEAVGLPLEQVMCLVDGQSRQPLVNLVQQVLESGELVKLTSTQAYTLLIAKDGSEHMVESSATPIRSEAGQLWGVVIVFKDITQQRKIEEELQKANKLDSVGILAGGIAHDFNNFLAAIVGNLALIRRSLPQDNPLYKNLREAESACLNARGLTQQLLTFSKGGVPVKKQASIAQLLTDATNFILRGTNSRGVILIATDLWQVEIDEGQISQVISNLVINAHQAMPSGGLVKVSANNVRFDSETLRHNLPIRPGNYIEITISDRGIGIPHDYLTKIFDPYFTTKQEGSGLGLAISYSIVKNHDGYIAVESELGVGTTFYVYLPGMQQEVTPMETSPVEMQHGSLRVLVMDDQEMIRELFGDILQEAGHSVAFARDGTEAVKIYQQALASNQLFDVVVMDLTVPGGMGGKEAVTRLLELDPAARVVVSSGYSNDPITSDYKKYGFKGVIPKPFEIDELLDTLARVAHKDDSSVKVAL